MKKPRKIIHSTAEFITLMKEVNPEIEILGEYKGFSQSILVKCKCGNVSKRFPTDLLENNPCKKCLAIAKRQRGENDFKKFLKDINEQGYEVEQIGQYIGANDKIEFKCVCGNHFKKSPSQMMRTNFLCCKCAQNRITYGELKGLISDNIKFFYSHNDNDIVTKREHIDCECTLCGRKWNTTFAQLIKGSKCICQSSKKLTHKEYEERVLNVNPDIKLLSKYINQESDITYMCACGNIHTKTRDYYLNQSPVRIVHKVLKKQLKYLKKKWR